MEKKISIEKRKKKKKKKLINSHTKKDKNKNQCGTLTWSFQTWKKKKSKLYTAKCLKFFLSFCGMFFLFVFILFFPSASNIERKFVTSFWEGRRVVRDNVETLKDEEDEDDGPNKSDQQMTVWSHWAKCAFQPLHRSLNFYCQNI